MSCRRIQLVSPGALALVVLFLAQPALAGKVYQWKDAKGVTHFSDAPPPDKQGVRNREIKAGPAAPEQAAAAPAEDPGCTTARKNLEHLKSDRPVGLDANGDGQPDKEMTAEERANQVALAEQTIKTYCTAAKP